MSDWVQMAPGVKRRILSDGEKMMLVEVVMEPGSKVPLHQHPHEQISHLLSGSGTYQVGDATLAVSARESVYLPGGVPHSFDATSACVVLDVFTPPREDFRAK